MLSDPFCNRICHLFVVLLLLSPPLSGWSAEDSPKVAINSDKKQKPDSKKTADPKKQDPAKVVEQGESQTSFEFKLNKDVEEFLVPLIKSIREADVSRVTVEMLSDAVMSGQVISSQKSVFQIAAKKPNKYTIYLKEPEQRTRVFSNGKEMVVAMAPDAFFTIDQATPIQEVVTDLSVPLGPYPEPLLALSMASADPAVSLIAGMRSVELVDRKPFKGKIPAVHLHGVQADAVSWDLWVTSKEPIKPLRMLVDLTPMLKASSQVHVPEGYSQQIRYDFLTWRVSGNLDDALFKFRPAKNAIEYDSLKHYFESMAGATGYHPSLGKPAPAFLAKTFGKKPFDSRSLKNRVVVLDFWSTWCPRCVESLTVIKKVADEFKKEGVVFIAINTGEEVEKVRTFLKKERLPINVLLDPDGKIADGFVVDAIPQTVVIGKDGVIESVHLGYADEDSLMERLRDELDVVTKGGHIGSIKNKPPPAKSKPDLQRMPRRKVKPEAAAKKATGKKAS